MAASESRVVAVVAQGHADLPMTTQSLIERRQVVAKVIDEVMVEGLHYGMIPGTQEMSLLKEGAELLLSTFHIAVEPVVTDQSTPNEVRFTVECRGTHMGSGAYVGSGIGVCSSNEEKYRWRRARTRAEYDNADLQHRRIKYSRGKGGQNYEDQQVRQSPWDVFHTIMSMAKKRGMVDLAKTALAASECLKKAKLNRKPTPTAGADPLTSGPSREGPGPSTAAPANASKAGTAPSTAKVQDKPGPATPPAKPSRYIDAEQARFLAGQVDHIGLPETEFLGHFEIGRFEDLEVDRFEAATAWLKTVAA